MCDSNSKELTITDRAIRRLLRAIALLAVIASVVVLFFALRPLVKPQSTVGNPSDTSPSVESSVPDNAATKTRDLSEFATVWNRRLSAPLYDPPPRPVAPKPIVETPKPVRPKPKKPRSQLRVMGTMVEPDRSLAILSDSDGEIHVCAVGESLETPEGEVSIESIDVDRVTVSENGRSHELRQP